jgi:hypothetical protein
MGQVETPGELLRRILDEFGIGHGRPPTVEEAANYEIAAAFFTQSAADCANKHSENTGLPCTFCGHAMKRLQIDADHDKGVLNVRVNQAFTKSEALKQAKGLAQLIKQFADGL